MSDTTFLLIFGIAFVLAECLGQIYFRVAILPNKLKIEYLNNEIIIAFRVLNMGDIRFIEFGTIFLVVPFTGSFAPNPSERNTLVLLTVLVILLVLAIRNAYKEFHHSIILRFRHRYVDISELSNGKLTKPVQGPYFLASVNYRAKMGPKIGPIIIYPLFGRATNDCEFDLIDCIDHQDIAKRIKEAIEAYLQLPVSQPILR